MFFFLNLEIFQLRINSYLKGWCYNMTAVYIVLIVLFLWFGATVMADVVTSSISCDGSAWIYSSVIDPNKSYKISAFTTKPSTIERKIVTDEILQTTSSIKSEGSLGIDEYSMQRGQITQKDQLICIFNNLSPNDQKEREISLSGILHHAGYDSTRVLGSEDLDATTLANGSGLLQLGKRIRNASSEQRDYSAVSGNMTISDSYQSGDD